MLQSDHICLSVRGKTLREPNAMLRETGLEAYSLVTCESSLLLQGGMKASNAVDEQENENKASKEET